MFHLGSYAQKTMKSNSVLPTIERAIALEGKVLYAA